VNPAYDEDAAALGPVDDAVDDLGGDAGRGGREAVVMLGVAVDGQQGGVRARQPRDVPVPVRGGDLEVAVRQAARKVLDAQGPGREDRDGPQARQVAGRRSVRVAEEINIGRGRMVGP
jgi:hypothetical protein